MGVSFNPREGVEVRVYSNDAWGELWTPVVRNTAAGFCEDTICTYRQLAAGPDLDPAIARYPPARFWIGQPPWPAPGRAREGSPPSLSKSGRRRTARTSRGPVSPPRTGTGHSPAPARRAAES